MRAQHPHRKRVRAHGALAIAALVLGALGFQFFRVQVLRSSDYKLRSESNRLRPLAVPAPRGTVFDRYGKVIADNVPGYAVYVLRDSRDETREALEGLRPHLGLSDARIATLMGRVRRHEPLLVDIDAEFAAISVLEERRESFPGVYIEMRPKRRYFGENAVAHTIGYVSEVTAEELESDRFVEYEQGILVGKVGIERQYEELLQGQQGIRYLEVDATGRIVGPLAGIEEDPGLPGEDLELTLAEAIHPYS